MRVYILDVFSSTLVQMVKWLHDDSKNPIVEVFEDDFKFIEKLEKELPDLCLIRLGNIKISGMKAADMVKCINQDIRIVFISDDRDYAIDAYEIGGYGYLLCPLEENKFKKLLDVIKC